MPSGYEQSPDYGGRPPTPRGIALGLIVFFILAGLLLWVRG